MNRWWPTQSGDLAGLPTPSFLKSYIYRGFVTTPWVPNKPNYSNIHHLVYNFWYTQGKTTVASRYFGSKYDKNSSFRIIDDSAQMENKERIQRHVQIDIFPACSRLWTWTRRTRSWRATSGSTWTGWTIPSSGMLQNTAGSRLEWSSNILYNIPLL